MRECDFGSCNELLVCGCVKPSQCAEAIGCHRPGTTEVKGESLRTAISFEVAGAQVVQREPTLAEVPSSELLLDKLLALKQPVGVEAPGAADWNLRSEVSFILGSCVAANVK